jgi:putative transposase
MLYSCISLPILKAFILDFWYFNIKNYKGARLDIDEVQSYSRRKRKFKPIWQKRYYKHTIRDKNDYQRCLEYMQNNPTKHNLVNDSKEWKYSSFNTPKNK